VVGCQVGGGVGAVAFPSWAPVADDGAVFGDGALAAAALGPLVEIRAALTLGAVVVALAVLTAALATHRPSAANAVT
jgi:hypothetical protein